ncbi:GPR1/FUN34/yaaH family-domain-containing protein [Scheffersomyces amazonensis]|uniref:GPR1/FUN34/yaaH family-domain-containing protein n=1 Tax=Scheffersomyces amazonensis TaxID=1078765 RepID=UPI00315D3B8C
MSSIDSPMNSKTNLSISSGSLPVKQVTYSGDRNEYVIIDNKKYLRHELMQAFGGTFNPGLAPYPKHKFANAAALGLAAFSITTFTLGLYTVGAMGIKISSVIVGLCFFFGGAVQFLAGVWEMAAGSTFAGTAFISYGSFWITYATMSVEAFGVAAAYKDEPEQFGNALGFYLIGWGLFTVMMIMCSLKSTFEFVGLLTTLLLAFLLLAAANMTGSASVTKAGGVLCLISASFGFYNMYSGIANEQNTYFILPSFPIPVYGDSK